MRRADLALLALLAVAACKLTEVTLNPGERTVVVQSVLNRDEGTQFAVIEYSFNGDTTGRTAGRRVIPPGRPQFPVTGARVTLTYPGSGSCAGHTDVLAEVPVNGTLGSGSYSGVPCALEPGARAVLTVTTPAGEIVTGETIMPGIRGSLVTAGADTARFPTDTISVWRERDTLRIAIDAAPGRAIQIQTGPAEDVGSLNLYLFSDSLGMAVAGDIVNPFDDDGTRIFHAGHYYSLAVVLGDSNYFDYIRSVSDPVTGRGYLNHIRNGYGVFGSVDMEEFVLRVSGDQIDPREGTYKFTGGVNDLTVELYLDRDPGFDGPDEPISGFVTGTVSEGYVDQGGTGLLGSAPGIPTRTPDAFQFAFQRFWPGTGPGTGFRRYTITGLRSGVLLNPFNVQLRVTGSNGQALPGRTVTLTGRQTAGPVSSGQP